MAMLFPFGGMCQWYFFLVPSLQAPMIMSEAACDNPLVCSCCLTSGKRVDPICCAEGVVPEGDLVEPIAFCCVLSQYRVID